MKQLLLLLWAVAGTVPASARPPSDNEIASAIQPEMRLRILLANTVFDAPETMNVIQLLGPDQVCEKVRPGFEALIAAEKAAWSDQLVQAYRNLAPQDRLSVAVEKGPQFAILVLAPLFEQVHLATLVPQLRLQSRAHENIVQPLAAEAMGTTPTLEDRAANLARFRTLAAKGSNYCGLRPEPLETR